MTPDVIIGIILLFINVPFGLGGFIYFVYIGRKYKNKIYYYIAFLTYLISWVMLFAGVFLCGETYSKFIIEKYVVKYTYLIIALILTILAFIYFFRKQIFKKLLKNLVIKKSKKK
ncbi:MAG: hypothetical protein PHI20_05205 [Endomicrobiaceae bacterium]|jgi:hypothetical protein|nr:hypothetical protein [Endomicrobiaceae bacterium]MDD3730414.1 hypothetical protein [Endomicrobiaceae bacterium]MDD4165484.1 hypothetical protein [Endomicrobiaceae bacterium]